MLHRTSALVFVIMLTGLPGVAIAQTPDPSKFIVEALPEESATRVENERKMFQLFGLADHDKTTKGVVNALKLWTYSYDAIRVCFLGGSREARERVVQVATEWKAAVPGLPLDFADAGDPPTCGSGHNINHIRISFNRKGYWSHVGTDSIRLVGQNQPSMNLQDLDWKFNDQTEFRSTVLHEFGHAIGFNHEHQNPMSACNSEFNWPLIRKWLHGPPNNWDDATIDFNMGALHEQGLLATSFDKSSIMLYTFPPEYFINGSGAKCYSKVNTELSAGDIDLARKLYPASPAAKMMVASEIRDHHLKLIGASGSSIGAKADIMPIIDQLLPADQ